TAPAGNLKPGPAYMVSFRGCNPPRRGWGSRTGSQSMIANSGGAIEAHFLSSSFELATSWRGAGGGSANMATSEKRAVTPARTATGVEGANARQVVREIRKLAIEYEQHGNPFYVTVWTAPELAENTTVPAYDPTTETGYQRIPKNPRVHRAAKHLASGGKFPGAILLSIRGADRDKISVHPMKDDGSGPGRLVELTIPEGVVIYLVDGQHRKFAVMEAIAKGKNLENFGLA